MSHPDAEKRGLPANLEADFAFVSRFLVMYSDLNAHGRLFGGRLMSWLDEGTAQVAMERMGTRNIVTKKFGEIVFQNPGQLGDSVEIWTRVEREGRTSLTLDCRVLVRGYSPEQEKRRQICHCSVVYVALDEEGRPRPWNPARRREGEPSRD
jgi:acyl-CoA hydrolase